jgi:hypothetical protein
MKVSGISAAGGSAGGVAILQLVTTERRIRIDTTVVADLGINVLRC